MINTKKLTPNEKNWIETLLNCEVLHKKEITEQINSAEIEREYSPYFIFINFNVDKGMDRISVAKRVPVEMRAYSDNDVAIQFLLHIVNGYVSQLEIFKADSSEISCDIDLKKYRIEHIFDNSLRIKLENILLSLGFEEVYVGVKNYRYFKYNNTYCKLTYIETFDAYVIESADNLTDAENNLLEDGDLYYTGTSEEELLKEFENDIVKYYME